MPLYEYECEKCGARFEVIQRFSDSPIEACRVCAGPVHKLISAPSIQFKGTGWYVTDYAKKDATAASLAHKNSSNGDGAKADTAAGATTPPPAATAADSSSTTSSSAGEKKS
jgi:putative FmdB family regulatory protein